MPNASPARTRILVPLALLVLLTLPAICYGDWIVDDAGITYAYARNVVEGHGWVAQPGREPIEGFTNLLWTLLLAASMAVGCFDTVWTAKVLGVLLGTFALVQVLGMFRRAPPPLRRAAAVGVVATALNPAYVIWCTSGLENPLLAALCAVACRHSHDRGLLGAPWFGSSFVAGMLSVACAACRPDAAVFAAGFPLLVMQNGGLAWRRRFLVAGVAVATTLIGLAAITAWRWHQFGDFVPNTFHVKAEADGTLARFSASAGLCALAGTCALALVAPSRTGAQRVLLATLAGLAFWLLPGQRLLRAIGRGIGGPLQVLAYFGLSTATTGGDRSCVVAVATFGHLSMLQFFALPRDWMGEFRFGTCFLLFGSVVLAIGLAGLASAVAARSWRAAPQLACALVAAVLLAVALDFARRALRWQHDRPVSFAAMLADQEQTLRWLSWLRTQQPSVLAPDLGGRLWRGGCRVHDLAGLCDRRIARQIGRDPQGLADLVFEELRPTLIDVHGYFAFASRLSQDPRLLRDYQAIQAAPDEWVRREKGIELLSGWFVRSDALPDASVLARLRAR